MLPAPPENFIKNYTIYREYKTINIIYYEKYLQTMYVCIIIYMLIEIPQLIRTEKKTWQERSRQLTQKQ